MAPFDSQSNEILMIIYLIVLLSPPVDAFTVQWTQRHRQFLSLSDSAPSTTVSSLIDEIFDPKLLESRIAISRTDGYWPFQQRGEAPPASLTYGEFEVESFLTILNSLDCTNQTTLVDVGSGMGRLVWAAALQYPELRQVRGLEVLPSLCEAAQQVQPTSDVSHAPIDFVCGSLDDPYVYLGDATIVFSFSTCMTDELVQELAINVARQCSEGTLLITTDRKVDLQGEVPQVPGNVHAFGHGAHTYELVSTVTDLPCSVLGGSSTAYCYRLVKTPSLDLGPIPMPLQEKSYRAVQEANKLTDIDAFRRGIYNQLVWHQP